MFAQNLQTSLNAHGMLSKPCEVSSSHHFEGNIPALRPGAFATLCRYMALRQELLVGRTHLFSMGLP